MTPQGGPLCPARQRGLHRRVRRPAPRPSRAGAPRGRACARARRCRGRAELRAAAARILRARRAAAAPDAARARSSKACATLGIDRRRPAALQRALAAMAAEDFVARRAGRRAAARARSGSAPISASATSARGDLALLQRLGAALGFIARHDRAGACVDGERVSQQRASARAARSRRLRRRRAPARPALRRSAATSCAASSSAARSAIPPRTCASAGKRAAVCGHLRGARAWRRSNAAVPGVASLGMRPTVDGTEPLLEAHLFDFDGDLYGRRIDVEFVRKLRDEAKFADLRCAGRADASRRGAGARPLAACTIQPAPGLRVTHRFTQAPTTRTRSTCPHTASRCAATCPSASRAGSREWEDEGLYERLRDARRGRPRSCCTTARRTPTARSTSATRSTRS